MQIETAHGIRGFVAPEVVHSPNEMHLCFGQRSGEWRITIVEADE